MDSITGRDDLIVSEALYEFARMQQARDKDAREFSNERDAIQILLAVYPRHAFRMVSTDEVVGRVPVNLHVAEAV